MSLLLTGYLELLIKQNFSQTPEGEQFNAERPCMPDRGLSINVTGFVKKSLYMHLILLTFRLSDLFCV